MEYLDYFNHIYFLILYTIDNKSLYSNDVVISCTFCTKTHINYIHSGATVELAIRIYPKKHIKIDLCPHFAKAVKYAALHKDIP